MAAVWVKFTTYQALWMCPNWHKGVGCELARDNIVYMKGGWLSSMLAVFFPRKAMASPVVKGLVVLLTCANDHYRKYLNEKNMIVRP